MSDPGAFGRVRRNLEFGRHVGARRVARRLEQQMKRALRDRLGDIALPAGEDDAAPVERPPLPVFPPRAGHVEFGRYGSRFTFHNRAVEMGERVAWDALGAGPGDQLWRMSLHYMEYLEALDDPKFVALVEDWVAVNTPHRRGAWRDSFNSYAVSLRTVVWMQQLATRAGRLPAACLTRAIASLRSQLAFLERNLEQDLGGNHLIKNIKALIWASAFFEGAAADRWRAKGLRLLADTIDEQVLADGMHYERSPSYHCQVFADLLECRHALGGAPLAGKLDGVLARMAQATADLTHPDGTVALFNDAGITMAYSPGECLAVYGRLFGRAPEARPIVALPATGYYVLRDRNTYFIADCGPIAPDELVAHGHGDVLSFEWSVAGKRLIVDQGVYGYSAGERRQQSRGAAEHNTLCLDGADQADFFGAFRCGRRPKVRVLAYEAGLDGFALEGSHDGFGYLPGEPSHVRRFEITGGAITIRDRVGGETDRVASIAFLLHPACDISIAGREAHIRRSGVEVVLNCTVPLRLEPAVWWPDMGVEERTQRLRAMLPPGERHAVTTLRVLAPLQG